jgi:deoxyribodipyrimidine photo-lyase
MIDINIFIFRRDLRFEDNTTLNLLLALDLPILPIFIFNQHQINPKLNKYFSNNCVQFMVESLKELSVNLYDSDDDLKILNELKKKYKIHTIGFNKDFTPFAIKRDNIIKEWCDKNNINLISEEDYTLFPIGNIKNNKNKTFEVFTPFYNKCKANSKLIRKPEIVHFQKNKLILNKNKINPDIYYKPNPDISVNGGRKKALMILDKIKNGDFKNYEKTRNVLSIEGTTKLSAYLKFGCISIREVYYCFNDKNNPIVRELIWREFYVNITFSFPKVLSGNSFKSKYNNIKWSYDKNNFTRWCNGTTGFPIVDAGIRQLNTTGWMHNRARMIVAMFLTKDLFIDWKMGEQYFASKLVDYDPSSNNGGWQWCSSTGTDSQPYFRIFNPYLQAKRFDKDCIYIKKWVPELKDIPNKDILTWDKNYIKYENMYYEPIVDHSIASKHAIKEFKNHL